MDIEKLGFLAIENGDWQEALNIFKRSMEKGRNAANLRGFGVASYNIGDLPTARWAFYKVLEIEPDDKDARGYVLKIERTRKKAPLPRRRSLFRAAKDYLEVHDDGRWKKFFIKGINLGLGLPGYFPGEYPVKGETYSGWFDKIAGLGINTIRTYAIHPPCFYEALYNFNRSMGRLYLLQGIWVELPGDGNFYGEEFISNVKGDIKNAVDVVYGSARLAPRPGFAHGIYDHDVSIYTMGFVFGREWESCAVKTFNEMRGRRPGEYWGGFLGIGGSAPFEVWVIGMCDFLQGYEHEKYRSSHPVSTVNWATLDPLEHPSESRYEEELKLQGIRVRKVECNENEDVETLDLKKVKVEKGAGFYTTYHVYPYYPDFINNDYLEEVNPYLAYLKALKAHHGDQPVLLAEFGVPSSREVTHWQRDGWHHGGHNEARQGEINGLLMKSIHGAGMAGGVLFSWFDEWFKRNWVFLPYELPAERNPFWFNLQDAEQNYGLLAAYPGYPGKKVKLSGDKTDWEEAVTLYEKEEETLFRFNDGFDEARALKRLSVQHDEGFLYIRVETYGRIDFSAARYLIGMDTGFSETGEFLLPFGTELISPVGMKFLVHITGRDTSRILVCSSYDKYLNMKKGEIRPYASDQGAWVMMMNRTNTRRISKDRKRFYPSRVFPMSALRFGSLERKTPHYDSLADFFISDNMIELRIPWGLLNITDPSSKTLLWFDKDNRTKKTEGVKIIAVSYKPESDQTVARKTGQGNNITDSLPPRLASEELRSYSWENWNTPVFHTYLKESYYVYREFLKTIPEAV